MVRHGETKSGAGHVLPSAIITCEQCGGGAFVVSTTIDDPNDITQDAAFAALDITITGGQFLGLVGKCKYCGHEQVFWWICEDTGTSNGTTITMTNLDEGTANALAGVYMVYIGADANDADKYFTVSTNTAATPTVITPTVAPHADSDGLYLITNLVPVGYTAKS